MCYPWYNGPDPFASTYFLEQATYYGRLSERSEWLAKGASAEGLTSLAPIDVTGQADLTDAEAGTVFKFSTCIEMFCSLPGMARERIVESCLEANVDYLFWADDDMIFEPSTFLRLYRNQVDICAALAFTARKPITPVIYSFTEMVDENGKPKLDTQPIFDYQGEALQKVDAFGTGVFLAKADVYRKVGKPWYSSYGCGEDIFFASRCRDVGVELHVDTRVKTIHKATVPMWHEEGGYVLQQQRDGKPVPVLA